MANLLGNVVQGSADAFAQASIQTALEGQTRRAYQINEVSFEVTGVQVFSGTTTIQDFEFALTRRSKSAMPDLDDLDLIHKWKFLGTNATSVGQVLQPDAIQVWQPSGVVLIVEDPIYIQVDSTATTNTFNIDVLIDYTVVDISEVDRLTLLTQSLV